MRNHRPDGTSALTTWDQLVGWTETRSLFVFRYRENGDLAWLPERGTPTPAELDLVRQTIAGNLPRL
ncbi:hypothetical protein HYE82_20730 [Streptomyces sp. BR123]|uniref:hypothetical protein n=1 Tax=Streptomyces sp. BR123 TaxID=2749828 RepID=UPI0015C482FB|nr:hypothetical protein [Streptomyces sp. BR123]NXY96765.1 hypothetical protein [Streptomyces sp. BR123]